jgi:integrase
MARKAGKRVGKLSALFVDGVTKEGLFGDGGNLFLKVDDRGNKSWIFRWSEAGKVKKLGLGPLHTIGLADARDRAEATRKLVLDGIDPRQVRREAKAAAAVAEAKTITFDAARDLYIEAHKAGWKNAKHVAQWTATLKTYASPHFGKLPVAAVDVGLVLRALEPIWTKKPETAHRVRGRIESVLDWARARGYRNGDNPARWKGHLSYLLPARGKVRKVQHHPSLPYAELPAFMVALRQQYGIAALALEFGILTAARTDEVLGASWSEIGGRLWIVPAERMKGKHEHRVPLCDRALAIVEEMKTVKRGEFIFPGQRRGKPLSNMSMLATLARMGRDDLTVHGFRSTFRTWSSERTNFPREIAEAALAHTIEDKTEAAYQRGDLLEKRRRLMHAWAAYCERKPAAKTTGDVVALRQSS